MSDWSYVALAYIVVSGALVLYALTLARRVASARRVARALRSAQRADAGRGGDASLCDAPPAP